MLSNETEAYNVPVATELLSDEWSYSKDEGTIQKKKDFYATYTENIWYILILSLTLKKVIISKM